MNPRTEGGGLCLLEVKDRGSSRKRRVLLFLIGPSLTQQPDGRSCNCWRNGRELCGRTHMQREKVLLALLQNQRLTQKSAWHRAKFPDTSRTPLFPWSALQYGADEKITGGSKVNDQVKVMKVRRERTASAPWHVLKLLWSGHSLYVSAILFSVGSN